MNTQTLHYSRTLTSAFFKDATHDDLRWTINYLISLLEIPESLEKSVIEPSESPKTSAPGISAHDFYGIWNDDAYECQEMIDDIRKNRSFKKEIIEL